MKISRFTPKGFTIVELLIVVVVIAILAAITIVSYNGITTRANQAKMASAVESMDKFAKTFVINGGTTSNFVDPACLTSSPSDLPAESGFAAGYCDTGGTFTVTTTQINTLNSTAAATLPKVSVPTYSFDGVKYRSLILIGIGNVLYLMYFQDGSSCLKSTDLKTDSSSGPTAVQCLRNLAV